MKVMKSSRHIVFASYPKELTTDVPEYSHMDSGKTSVERHRKSAKVFFHHHITSPYCPLRHLIRVIGTALAILAMFNNIFSFVRLLGRAGTWTGGYLLPTSKAEIFNLTFRSKLDPSPNLTIAMHCHRRNVTRYHFFHCFNFFGLYLQEQIMA